MKEFNCYISDDGLKIGTKQEVLDYEDSCDPACTLISKLKGEYFYDDLESHFFVGTNSHSFKSFLTNKYVVELFCLFNGKEVESVVINENQGTISMERSVIRRGS